ncbi:PREDICTED: SH2 domain-containing protein 2A [Haliaeetus leucocephalus]|nr:PREDICTED: SH2 domain-containing protein 2A [Haliaeetus leucocephalus]
MPPSCDVSPSREGSCGIGRRFLPFTGSRGASAGKAAALPALPACPVPSALAMDSRVTAWPDRGDPMDDHRPLFSTFKPISEDNMASAKPGPDMTLVQPWGEEQSLGHQDTHSRVPASSWPSPPGWSPQAGNPQPELVALRARTRLWFEQTQARRLGAEGELPAWFHGFISRRDTEQLLQDQPPGCFLVRFSESTVGFVLSYRGRDRCRHFVLDQLPDGRYVILGEQSAHAELADLLQHYATAPVTPYHEFLTVPRRREDEPQGQTQSPASSDAVRSQSSEAPPNLLVYSTVLKGSPGAAPPLPAEPSAKGSSSREALSIPPPLPAKASSLATAQGPHSPASGGATPYAQVHEEAILSELLDAKYQQLMCFHTYAEPHEDTARSPSTNYEPEELIPFYAMGRGLSPSTGPQENIYSEVALARQDLPALLSQGTHGAFSTLPSKSRAHRRLFRSVSSQVSKRRQLPAVPTADKKERGASSRTAEIPQDTTNPPLKFSDPVYSRRTSAAKQATAAAGQESPENIYEQLSGQHL